MSISTKIPYPGGLYNSDLGPRVTDDYPIFLTRHQSKDVAKELMSNANILVDSENRARGVYACDEEPHGFDEQLIELGANENLSAEEKKERRKRVKECLFRAANPEHISGVLMCVETFFDFNLNHILTDKGIMIGIRAHTDEFPFPSSPHEYISAGLDDLVNLLKKAKDLGATFAKFRAPISCTSFEGGLPTQNAMDVQADVMGRFASICQQYGLVPVLELEVDFSEKASLERSADIHLKVLAAIFARCVAHSVLTEGLIVQPSFPQTGLQHPLREDNYEEPLALAAASILARALPVAVAGVFFLSNGLSPVRAVNWLRHINEKIVSSRPPSPFCRLPPLTFAYRMPLQIEPMKFWVEGKEEEAKKSFQHWCEVCSLALQGKGHEEQESSDESEG